MLTRTGVPAHPVVVGMALLVSGAIAVGATLAPLLTIAFAVAAALAALTVGSLTFGVALFTLLTFFETLPGLDGIALSRPFGVVLLVSWLAALVRNPSELPLLHRDRPLLAYVLVSFVGWAGISALWAADSAVAISNASRLGLTVALVFILFTALRTPRDVTIVAWAFLTGAFLVAVVGLATGANKAGRLALGELDPNTLAASLSAALLLALFLVWSLEHRGAQVLLALFMCVYGVAIVRTESRGALVALAVAACAAVIFGGPARSRIVGTLIIIVAIGVGYYAFAAPADVRERAASTVGGQRDPRFDTWSIARSMTGDHPILGVGLGNFTVVQSRYLPGQASLVGVRKLHNTPLVAHNTYLEILAELGIVGLALFVAIVVSIAGGAIRSLGRISARSPSAELTVRGLIAVLSVFLTAYAFVSGTYAKHIWLLVGVLAAAASIVRDVKRPLT